VNTVGMHTKVQIETDTQHTHTGCRVSPVEVNENTVHDILPLSVGMALPVIITLIWL
jgi:hypothetical protein